MWLEVDGRYTEHHNHTAVKGLTADQIAPLKELLSVELHEKYLADRVPLDGSVNLMGNATAPIYRVVVRKEADRIVAGTELLDVYLEDRGANNLETTRLLDRVKMILQIGIGGSP